MIGDYATLIQFFAAIYLTLSFDNVLFKNIWSLNYVQIIQSRMKILFSEKSGTLFDNKIKSTIEETVSIVEKQSRLRGFVCLFLSVFTLWYIGGETVLSQNGIEGFTILQYHLPYTLFLLSTTIVFFIVVVWVNRLLYVAILCTLALVIYIAAYIFDCNILLNIRFVRVITENINNIIPVALFIPLAYQLFVSWLYSDNYYYILGGKIKKEHELYNKAINAKEPEELPEEYDEAIKTTFFDKQKDSKSDTKVTNIVSILNKRLQNTLSVPSMFEILKYALHNLFKVRTDVLKEYAVPQINGESINDVSQSSGIDESDVFSNPQTEGTN